MSVRRRKIHERVARGARERKQHEEFTRPLKRLQAHIAAVRAEGRTTMSQEEIGAVLRGDQPTAEPRP